MWKSACFRSGVTFKLLSIPLQNGIRFFHYPIPASHSAFLAVGLPAYTGEIRAYHVPYEVTYGWVRFCLLRRQCYVRVFSEWRRISDCFPFWVKALTSIVGFFNLTTFKRQFAYANHTTQAKLPDRMILTAIVFPSRF